MGLRCESLVANLKFGVGGTKFYRAKLVGQNLTNFTIFGFLNTQLPINGTEFKLTKFKVASNWLEWLSKGPTSCPRDLYFG